MGLIDRKYGLVGNTGIKTPVKVASTGNLTLAAEQTIDGVACVEGDRVLLKDQIDTIENGIWVVSTGSWSRASDFNGSYDAVQGTLIVVNEGTVSSNSVYKVTTDDPVTIGTSSLTFAWQSPASLAALSASSGSSLIGYITGGVVATPITVQDKLRNLDSFITYPSVNPLGYGRNWFDIQVPVVGDFIDNVFSVQNKSSNGTIYGNAAIAFLDGAGTERGAVGYSRNSVVQPDGYYAEKLYIEIGNPFTTDTETTDFVVINTIAAGGPYWGGAAKSYFPIEVRSDTGTILLEAGSGGGIIKLTGGTTVLDNLAVGDVTTGVASVSVAMDSTAIRIRERGILDQLAITTNLGDDSGGTSLQDNSALSSWSLSMGGGFDNFVIGRTPAGSDVTAANVPFVTILSTGNVLLGQTATSAGADGLLSITSGGGISPITAKATVTGLPSIIAFNSDTAGDNQFLNFATETGYTLRGSITYNRGGGLVAYNTTSDYRAKIVTGNVLNALDRVALLKPCHGRMLNADQEIDFFVAHELAEVVPMAVTGEKDATDIDGNPIYQMVDKSTMIPLLTAAIQELRTMLMQ